MTIDDDKKYRLICNAESFTRGMCAAFCVWIAYYAIINYFGLYGEEGIENFEEKIMKLGVAVIIGFVIRIMITFYRHHLDNVRTDDYFTITFPEAYKSAKKGMRLESTNRMIMENGPEGRPVMTKNGEGISGDDFSAAVNTYWRRIKEESNDDS